MAITITEALAELKTIDKRIDKKREFIVSNLARQEAFKDPLSKDGGSPEVIRRELQAVTDLENRKVAIRKAIHNANHATSVTVAGTARTIAEWLTWRRDVVPKQQQFLASIRQRIDAVRKEAQRKGLTVVDGNSSVSIQNAKPNDLIVNVSESDLAKKIEGLEETLGFLDGQLSLKNATVTVDV